MHACLALASSRRLNVERCQSESAALRFIIIMQICDSIAAMRDNDDARCVCVCVCLVQRSCVVIVIDRQRLLHMLEVISVCVFLQFWRVQHELEMLAGNECARSSVCVCVCVSEVRDARRNPPAAVDWVGPAMCVRSRMCVIHIESATAVVCVCAHHFYK